MADEKKIEPARNATPARSDAAFSGEHSVADGEEIKEEFKKEADSREEPKKMAKSFFKKASKPENKELDYLLGWKRCMADFENYKKRQQENQKSIGEYVREDFSLQLLPVIDNFRSATGHVPEEQKEVPWVVGVMYIQKQLEDILKENGISEMDVKAGDEFDPNLHEAIADNSQKNEDEDGSKDEKVHLNKITRVVLQGYKIGEKVIRAARVIVE